MTTIGFAFLVATCLFLWFPQTRALGVVGVFVLLCINPFLFGFLAIVGLYVYVSFWRKRYYPLAPFLPKNNKKNALIPLLAMPWLGGPIQSTEPPTQADATPLSTDSVQASAETEVPVETVG